MKVLTILALIVFAVIIISLAGLGYNLVRLTTIVQSMPDTTLAVDHRWHTDAPPAGEPIIGLWYDGYVPRAHVVVMVYGAAYPYEPTGPAIKAIEYDAPVYWRRLP